jgi:hypothetical protein
LGLDAGKASPGIDFASLVETAIWLSVSHTVGPTPLASLLIIGLS